MTSPVSVHSELDARTAIASLSAFTALSLEDAAEALGISRPTLSRIRSGRGLGRQDISGLCAGVIRELYSTASGVALACQLIELELRLQHLGIECPSGGFGLLARAEDRLDQMVRTDYSALEVADRLALASLEGQIALYNARAVESREARRVCYVWAYDALTAQTDLILRQFALDELAWDSDRVLGLRILLNAFFAAWEIDLLEGEGATLPRARMVAGKLSQPGVLRKARVIARLIGDPRLSYQAAEAAAIAGHHEAAGNLLNDAIEVDGADPADPLGWHPEWLPTPIRDEQHFEAAISCLLSRYRFNHKGKKA